MATCTADLLSDASCLECLNTQQLLAIIACQLADQNSMACDPDTLLSDAACLTCLTPQQLLAIIACQLASGGGSGGGGAGVTSGSGAPPTDGTVLTYIYEDDDAGWFYFNTGTIALPVWVIH